MVPKTLKWTQMIGITYAIFELEILKEHTTKICTFSLFLILSSYCIIFAEKRKKSSYCIMVNLKIKFATAMLMSSNKVLVLFQLIVVRRMLISTGLPV